MRQTAGLALTLFLAIPGGVAGSGGEMASPTASPEQEAIEVYNEGISHRDKATAYEKEAAAEADAGKKEKLEAKARDRHEASVKKFLAAVKKDPHMFQAWGSLGYAYRMTGNLTASLEAYAKALEIQPAYTPAIEYRAEAYLGLGRLDEVKSAYMTLFNSDRPRADELTTAIDRWLEKKKASPAGIDPAKLDEFGKWASERKQLAAQTSSVTSGQGLRW